MNSFWHYRLLQHLLASPTFLTVISRLKVIGAEQEDLVVDLCLDVIGHSLFESRNHRAMMQDIGDGEVHQRMMYNISHPGKAAWSIKSPTGQTLKHSFVHKSVYCERSLLSFHHPPVSVIDYIELSKRPCYSWHLYCRANNRVAGKRAGRRTFSNLPRSNSDAMGNSNSVVQWDRRTKLRRRSQTSPTHTLGIRTEGGERLTGR